MKRPAEALVADFEKVLKDGEEVASKMSQQFVGIQVTAGTVRRWLKLAKSIDARFRKDGSKLNKRAKR